MPGPPTLTTVLTGPQAVETSTLTARSSSQLLEEASTATVQLHGTLPAGAGVPPDLAGRTVEVSAERRYSRRLTSEWPRSLPPAPPWVAVILVVLVGGWLAVEVRRWVRRPAL